MPSDYVDISKEEMTYIDGGGWVGFRIYISDGTRALGTVGGTAAVAGVVANLTQKFAAAGPWGAGAAAALTTLAGGVAGLAIQNNWEHADITVNIPFVNDWIIEGWA